MEAQVMDKLLSRVEKPARYIGNEWNMIRKESYDFRFALCFPDVYEIGMSHQGSRILYHILNGSTANAAMRRGRTWNAR